MEKERKRIILTCAAIIAALMVGALIGMFCENKFGLFKNEDLNSKNKNTIFLPSDSFTEDLKSIKDDSNKLRQLTKNNKSAKEYYNSIMLSINNINDFYNEMISATQNSYYTVSGNTKSWTKSNVKLTINEPTIGLEPQSYSFDNGKTWQKSNEKTFTNSQIAYIKIKYDNNLQSAVNIQNIKIDKKAPTVKFSISGNKYKGGYKSGAIITAICQDSQSGITYMKTYDTQDKKDYRQYKSKAVSSNTHKISLVTPGNARNITVECKDTAGNITKIKSPSYKISY